MDNFSFYRPTTPQQAVGLLDNKWGTAELLGGGTDLVSRQKEYISRPKKVVSLRDVAGLDKIEQSRGWPMTFVIGAGATLAALAEHSGVKGTALGQAAAEVAGPQIR